MRPPSFRIFDGEPPGSLVLQYTSERLGLGYFVMGAAKAAARELFNLEIEMKPWNIDAGKDHLEFLITQPSANNNNCNSIDHIEQPTFAFGNDLQMELESVIDPVSFCQAFPFHLIFDRDLVICQAGVSLVRVIPDLTPGFTKFTDAFSLIRPHIAMTFENILFRENAVFIVKTKEGWMKRPSLQEDTHQENNDNVEENNDGDNEENLLTNDMLGEDKALRLKGQMVFLEESDTVMFLCSPRILSLDSLDEKGKKILTIESF